MIVYKIKDSKIVSISTKDENYVIKEGEFGSDTWFIKPFWNGSNVVESITQAEIDERTETEAEQNALNIVSQRIADGEDFFNKVATKVKRAYDNGNITQTQFKNIRVSLKDVLLPLRFGDWDLAQDNINLVNRPSGQLGGLYDFLKDKIDQYVLDHY